MWKMVVLWLSREFKNAWKDVQFQQWRHILMFFHLRKNDQHSAENFPWTLWPSCTSPCFLDMHPYTRSLWKCFKIWLLTWYKMCLDFGYTYTVYGYRSKWYPLCLECFGTNVYKETVMHKDILSRRITTKTTVECVTTWHRESVCVHSASHQQKQRWDISGDFVIHEQMWFKLSVHKLFMGMST